MLEKKKIFRYLAILESLVSNIILGIEGTFRSIFFTEEDTNVFFQISSNSFLKMLQRRSGSLQNVWPPFRSRSSNPSRADLRENDPKKEETIRYDDVSRKRHRSRTVREKRTCEKTSGGQYFLSSSDPSKFPSQFILTVRSFKQSKL